MISSILTQLPNVPFLKGCVALTEGLDGEADPFSLDSLFEKDSLFGSVPFIDSDAFFEVPAPVFLCHTVTSTFSVAKCLADRALLPPWGAVIATEQRNGKGQYNRTWFSPKGNLYVTFRLPNEEPFQMNDAAIVVGFLLAVSLQRLDYPVKIKWPNDLLNAMDQKAAGILVEKRGDFLLAGVGINLSQLPREEDLRRDRSTAAGFLLSSKATSCHLSPFPLWQALVNEVIFAYSQFLAQLKAKTLSHLVDAYLAWKDQYVNLSLGNGEILSGWLRGISVSGGIQIQTLDGTIQEQYQGSLSCA